MEAKAKEIRVARVCLRLLCLSRLVACCCWQPDCTMVCIPTYGDNERMYEPWGGTIRAPIGVHSPVTGLFLDFISPFAQIQARH